MNMACHDKEKTLSYILGEIVPQEEAPLKDHMGTCQECSTLLDAVEETRQILGKRRLPKEPAGLADRCMQKIQTEHPDKRKASRSWSPLDRLLIWPVPVRRWAFITVVFCLGIGFGKVLFNPPTWLERYEYLFNNETIFDDGNPNRVLHNYLLGVETLFLNLSNMDDPSLLNDDEWEMEMDVTRKMLHRTRQIKNRVEREDDALYHLVNEIEWVLDDIIGTAEINLAGLSRDVRETIDKQQLLTKIHGFIS